MRNRRGRFIRSEEDRLPEQRPPCAHCAMPMTYNYPVGQPKSHKKEWLHASTFKAQCNDGKTVATYTEPIIEEEPKE